MAGLFDKAKDALDSEQGENMSDEALDRAAAEASKRTGGAHDEQIAAGREKADGFIGEQG